MTPVDHRLQGWGSTTGCPQIKAQRVDGSGNALDFIPIPPHGPLTRYVKLRVVHAPGMLGTFSPPPTSKEPLFSDPDMHDGTCITHVPWCMLGSLTSGGGENVHDIAGVCATCNFTYLAGGPLWYCYRVFWRHWSYEHRRGQSMKDNMPTNVTKNR